MKKVIFLLAISILLSGCINNNGIVGTWKLDGPAYATYQFLSNGDVIYVLDGQTVNGKFRQIDDSHIALTFYVGKPPYKERNVEIKISGDELTMNIEQFGTLKLIRVK